MSLLDRAAFEQEVSSCPGSLLLIELKLEGSASPSLSSDLPIQHLLKQLVGALPSEASLSRHGGGLVAAWLPDTSRDEAAGIFLELADALSSPIQAGASEHLAPGENAALLLDRADRALTRARAEGGWAIWEESLDRGRPRADPLAGIFTAHPERTYRNTQLLLETLEQAALAGDLEALLPAALARVLHLSGAERGLLMLSGQQGALETALARDADGQPSEMVDQYSRSIPREGAIGPVRTALEVRDNPAPRLRVPEEENIVLRDSGNGEKPSLLYLNPITDDFPWQINVSGAAQSVASNYWYNQLGLSIQTNDMLATWEYRMTADSELHITETGSK